MSAIKKIFFGLFHCFIGIHKDNWSYKIVSFLGLAFRVGLLPLLLPNIFEIFADMMISSWRLPVWAYELLIRIFLFIIDVVGLSNFFYWISYPSVGNSYQSGTFPAWGSFCYTLYYLAYNALVIVLIRFFKYWVICVSFFVLLLICALIYFFSYKLNTVPDGWGVRMSIHAGSIAIVFILLMVIRAII